MALMEGIYADLDKLKVIREWLEPKTLIETYSFHGLVYFYRRFIKRFSTITAPISGCFRLETFKWTLAAHKAYLDIKQKKIEAPVLRYFDLSMVFEIACDVSV